MSGRTIRVLPMRKFDFSQLSDGATQIIPIAERIDSSQYTTAEIIVRAHARQIADGGSVTVHLGIDGYTHEDPAATPPFLKPIASVQINNNFADEKLFVATATGLGSMLAVFIAAQQSDPGDAQWISISIDLALKGA